MSTRTIAAAIGALAAIAACRSDPPTEQINVAFTIAIDATDYRTWDFDFEASEDFAVDWVDTETLRGLVVDAVEVELAALGYERSSGSDVDFLVSYEFWVEEGTTPASTEARAKGSLVLRDARTGRFLWRATRKAPVYPAQPRVDMETGVRAFVHEMLSFVSRLREKIWEAQ